MRDLLSDTSKVKARAPQNSARPIERGNIRTKGGESVQESVKDMKRFNLNLPNEIVEQLEVIAESKGTNIQTLIRRFIILGLTAIDLEQNGDDGLIMRRGGVERLVTFF